MITTVKQPYDGFVEIHIVYFAMAFASLSQAQVSLSHNLGGNPRIQKLLRPFADQHFAFAQVPYTDSFLKVIIEAFFRGSNNGHN